MSNNTNYVDTRPVVTTENNSLICASTEQCKGIIYQCKNGMDCKLNCTGTDSCKFATIICPDTPYTCTVDIVKSEVCKFVFLFCYYYFV